jgi:hypothetical protein
MTVPQSKYTPRGGEIFFEFSVYLVAFKVFFLYAILYLKYHFQQTTRPLRLYHICFYVSLCNIYSHTHDKHTKWPSDFPIATSHVFISPTHIQYFIQPFRNYGYDCLRHFSA